MWHVRFAFFPTLSFVTPHIHTWELTSWGRWGISCWLFLVRCIPIVRDSEWQTSGHIAASQNFTAVSCFFLSSVSGAFPVSLQLRPEGPPEEPVTGKKYKQISPAFWCWGYIYFAVSCELVRMEKWGKRIGIIFRWISQNVTGTSRTGSTTSRDTSGLQPPTGLPSTRKR